MVDPASEKLSLHWRDAFGQPYQTFDKLLTALPTNSVQFAMNAGMYHADYSPVGLLIIDGVEYAPLNLADGVGNFFLKPNGVFFLSSTGAHVVAATEYPSVAKEVRLATQSGPLLLQQGQIHPAFQPQSRSRLIRNGVGVAGNKIFFVISEVPVNFYEFASFFRDKLHCNDALYLDGSISSLYSSYLQRHDRKSKLGPNVCRHAHKYE